MRKLLSTRQLTYVWRNTEALLRNHCCGGKAINITYYEIMFVALVLQHEKRMRSILLSFVASFGVPYFSTLSHKRIDFRKNNHCKSNVCSDLLHNFYFFLKYSHSKKNWARWSYMYVGLHVKHLKVYGSVHRNNIIIYIQQDAMLHSLFYLETALHFSGGTITHYQEHNLLYLHHLAFVTPLLLSAAIVKELELVWVCCGWCRPNTAHSNQYTGRPLTRTDYTRSCINTIVLLRTRT